MRSILAMLLLSAGGFSQPQPLAFDEFQTSSGPVRIAAVQHGSVLLQAGSKIIYIDPAVGEYESMPKADLILITDTHPFAMAPRVVERLRKPGTIIFGPEAVAAVIPDAMAIANGESRHWFQWIIDAVPAYSTKRTVGVPYHPRGASNGYVLNYGGKRFYFSGDTGDIPEIRDLRSIDVAFICMHEHAMTPQAAAAAVRAFHPKVVYPYRYRFAESEDFDKAMVGSAIEVRLRDWYSH